MGSSYFGDQPNMGSGGSSSSASRKGKKSNSDKPKQPQRGLGVAQLEKIRLHGQMGFMNPYPTTNNFINNNQVVEETRVQAAAYSSSFGSSQSSSSPSVSYGFHPNIMGLNSYDQRSNMIYGDHHSQLYTTTPRWEPSNAMLETTHQQFLPSSTTRHLLNPPAVILEEFQHKMNKIHRSNSLGSSSQNSESSESQEVDLELRLSL